MVKKTVFIAAGLTLLLGLLFGRDAVSYVSTSVSQLSQSVRDSVPIEFEIKRARDMIKDITPEIRRSMHLIAKEEVAVENLAKQIGGLEQKLAKDESSVLKLKADLQSNEGYFYYASTRYTRDQVQADLARRFEEFKTNDATLGSLKKVLNAREQSLESARQKLEGMMAAKQQLEVDVENLEARMKMVEVAQATADFQFDDSHLARTKKALSEIGTRIDVAERMVNTNSNFKFEIPVDQVEDNKSVVEEVTQYFSKRPTEEGFVKTKVEAGN